MRGALARSDSGEDRERFAQIGRREDAGARADEPTAGRASDWFVRVGRYNASPMSQCEQTSTSAAVLQLRPPHPPGFRLRRIRNWFFLGLLYAAYYLCRYNLGIVSPELTKEFNYSNEQYGFISSARDGGYAVGQLINGLLADGLGGKQSMALGALGTILFNLLFGAASWWSAPWLLWAFVVIRLLDGYMQSFGAPGMIKINTAWFQRRERGRFAGIFGGMIQLGTVGAGTLGKLLLVGFTIPVFGLAIRGLDWRAMFFVPPVILLVIAALMWLNVKNNPEEAGYRVAHDDEDADARHEEPVRLRDVFARIATNPLAWVNALAYFSTGFVRRALESWWVLYMLNVWKVGKQAADGQPDYYTWLVWLLPVSAFIGSLSSGVISDTLFGGRRSPVAAALYGIETVCILLSLYLLGFTDYGSPALACVMLTIISLTCNSSHSIVGAAVPMDLGGRKMAGCAAGIIDSFQYFGSILAGALLGNWIDAYGWNALFWAMLPFSAFGAILMSVVWLATRRHDVRGS